MATFLGKSVIIVDKVKKTNQTSFCQNCDLVFGNEDLCEVHSCLTIKQENPDVIDFGKKVIIAMYPVSTASIYMDR